MDPVLCAYIPLLQCDCKDMGFLYKLVVDPQSSAVNSDSVICVRVQTLSLRLLYVRKRHRMHSYVISERKIEMFATNWMQING